MINNVELIKINYISEMNGDISFLETPFDVKRIFYVSMVKPSYIRGHHAHKKCKQLLICIKGSVDIICDNLESERKFCISSSDNIGLYIPPMVWSSQFYQSRDTILVGLASHPFDESDYIRDYEEYKDLIS